MNPTVEQTRERLGKAPSFVRDLIMSLEIVKATNEAGTQAKLTPQQINNLGAEIVLTLLGFKPYDAFQKNIESTLRLNPDQSRQVTAVISRTIFTPIIGPLKDYWAGKSADINPQTTATVKTSGPEMQQPTAPAIQRPSITDNKLTSVTRLPRQDIVVSDKKLPTLQVMPKSPAELKNQQEQEKKQNYQNFDPYREQAK